MIIASRPTLSNVRRYAEPFHNCPRTAPALECPKDFFDGARMSDRRHTTGALGEALACEALRRRGYEIVARGWRCPEGEVDIVARDGTCWVFVEVKTRRGQAAGLPEEALTRRKLRKLADLAPLYLAERGLGDVDWRIDLVAIELDGCDRVLRLDILPSIVMD